MAKAVFLDKDGTLIPDFPYNVDPSLIKIEKNSIEGLKILHENGFLLIVVSNQAGVAHGFFGEQDLIKVREKIETLLDEENIKLNDWYFCPHHPEGKIEEYSIECNCRKPQNGMLIKAAKEHDIDLKNSWMIGDILNDIEAGNKAGCKSILINNGNETEWIINEHRSPFEIVDNINEAASIIVNDVLKSTLNNGSRLGKL